ncbi:hypothetical protein N7471_002805 [Penicillium samsonianum]|uniref:uncharacterized protein n=1 Tax=Penicillium samsonianum TaxID=1882272 RepID=UPI00254842F9|nr:uncharacterized protein N7471_002805 [Penicillium samsonianum]KAJ6143352.1 hypothetical protein N7471_002805 [Penicillium samsonianum]
MIADALGLPVDCSYIPLSGLRRAGDVWADVVFGVVQAPNKRSELKAGCSFSLIALVDRFERAGMKRV